MEIKSGSIKDLFGQSFIYGIGLFLRKALAFFLIPLYTHVFTHTQYGKLAMVYLFSGALTTFFNLGLDAAFLKQFTDEKYDKKEVYSRLFLFRLAYSSFFLLLIFLFSPGLSNLLLTSKDINLIQLASITIWIECLATPGLLILRITNRSKKYVFINTSRFVINIALNILLVLYYKMGITGVLLGNLGSSFILLVLLYPEMRKLLTIKLQWGPLKRLLHYGLPLLPLSIIIWIGLDLIDRWLIKWILGLDKTGIYTLGYQFGTAMGVLVYGFCGAWTAFFYNNPENKKAFVESSVIFVRFALLLWAVLSFFTPEIFRGMVSEKYWAAQSIVPIIALSYIFFGLEEIFTAGFYIKSRTGLLIPIALTPLLVNISLNLYLIPIYGIMGAAVSTLLSYFLFAVFSYLIGNKIFPVRYNLKTISLDIGLGIILLGSTTLAGNTLYQRILAFLILILTLSFKEKEKIRKLFKNLYIKD
ncbi:oligosaccharide flippase family protein [candidate division WOR-3 bacterium]|nr:oligosaccharide flippase family protein [candidate division WOR-3 bacterium]